MGKDPVRASFKRFTTALMVAAAIWACGSSDEGGGGAGGGGGSSSFMATGDLVVSNTLSDAVLLLDSAGAFKAVLYDVQNASETTYGVGWMSSTSEILVTVDGSDRVIAISKETGAVRTLITDANLAGALRGVTQLASGDILIAESNVVERFTSLGFRVTAGGWPMALQTTGIEVRARDAGGFVHCSTGADIIATYDDAGVLQNSTVSGIGGTTNAYGCMELSDGRIAGVWNGTTDTVAIYPANLGPSVMTYSDLSTLNNPRGVGERANGNLLILDSTFHHIVEITAAGAFVNILGGSVLNSPQQIVVVP